MSYRRLHGVLNDTLGDGGAGGGEILANHSNMTLHCVGLWTDSAITPKLHSRPPALSLQSTPRLCAPACRHGAETADRPTSLRVDSASWPPDLTTRLGHSRVDRSTVAVFPQVQTHATARCMVQAPQSRMRPGGPSSPISGAAPPPTSASTSAASPSSVWRRCCRASLASPACRATCGVSRASASQTWTAALGADLGRSCIVHAHARSQAHTHVSIPLLRPIIRDMET